MINGIYLTTSGMDVNQKRMEVLSGNLANINSVGYKKRNISFLPFRDIEISNLKNNSLLGNNSANLVITETTVNLENGSLKFTENPLDFALNSRNFFVVEDLNGNQLLTKNGFFELDSENYLVNQDGFKVLAENGYINITDIGSFGVDTEANILIDGEKTDKIKVVSVGSYEDLVVTDSPYFLLKDTAEAAEGIRVNLKQGFLETSNVNGVEEMVNMIAIMRAYEASQKALHMQDETLSKVVNQVGKTNI